MEKIEITLSFDSEKMEALVIYLKKEKKGKQRITFTIRVLYVKMRFMYLSFYIK